MNPLQQLLACKHKNTGHGGGGGGGAAAPSPVSETFNFFWQNADDKGKSNQEKTFQKVVKARLVGSFSDIQNGVKVHVKRCKDPVILF